MTKERKILLNYLLKQYKQSLRQADWEQGLPKKGSKTWKFAQMLAKLQRQHNTRVPAIITHEWIRGLLKNPSLDNQKSRSEIWNVLFDQQGYKNLSDEIIYYDAKKLDKMLNDEPDRFHKKFWTAPIRWGFNGY